MEYFCRVFGAHSHLFVPHCRHQSTKQQLTFRKCATQNNYALLSGFAALMLWTTSTLSLCEKWILFLLKSFMSCVVPGLLLLLEIFAKPMQTNMRHHQKIVWHIQISVARLAITTHNYVKVSESKKCSAAVAPPECQRWIIVYITPAIQSINSPPSEFKWRVSGRRWSDYSKCESIHIWILDIWMEMNSPHRSICVCLSSRYWEVIPPHLCYQWE